MIRKIEIVLQVAFVASVFLAQNEAATVAVCAVDQMASRVGPYGAGMGHQITELIFKNVSKNRCSLDVASLAFWRMKPKPGGARDDKNSHMPTWVFRDAAVNMDGAGSPTTVLEAAQETAVTMDTLNRTGYDEQHVCATQIRVGIAGQSKPLLDFESISCEERIFVSGFHAVRE